MTVAAETVGERSRPLPLMLLVGVALGLCGLFYLSQSGAAEARLILFATALFGIGLLAVHLIAPPEAKQYLVSVFSLAFGAHLLVLAIVYVYLMATEGSPALFPDELRFDLYSWNILQDWRGGSASDLSSLRDPGYYFLNAVTYNIVGRDLLGPRLVNVGLASLLVVPIYGIAKLAYDEKVARPASLLVGVLPTMLVWSAFQIKDVAAALLVAFLVWQFLVIREGDSPSRRALVWAIGLSLLLFAFRLESAAIVTALGVAGLLFSPGLGRPSRRGFLAIGLAAFAVAAWLLAGTEEANLQKLGLSAVTERREIYTAVIDQRNTDTSVMRGLLVDGGIANWALLWPAFLLAPLIQPIPTLADHISRFLAPGMIFSYVIIYPFAMHGSWHSMKSQPSRTFLVWAVPAVLLVGLLVTTFVSIRYRIQIEPLIVVLAVYGMSARKSMHPLFLPFYFIAAVILVVGYLLVKGNGIA